MFLYNILVIDNDYHSEWMCVPEVCSHEIVCVEDSFAAGEEGAADQSCYN